MTIHTFKCTQCKAENEIQIIDDVEDIDGKDYTRLEKLVEWEYSGQEYERYWHDTDFLEGQMIAHYRLMLEDAEYRDDIRLFCDKILYENLMSDVRSDKPYISKMRLIEECVKRYRKEFIG